MTQKDLDCLKKYLDIKVAHCNISETQAQDIYDMMRINCPKESITEEELDRFAVRFTPIELILQCDVKDGTSLIKLLRECFKAGYRKALNK